MLRIGNALIQPCIASLATMEMPHSVKAISASHKKNTKLVRTKAGALRTQYYNIAAANARCAKNPWVAIAGNQKRAHRESSSTRTPTAIANTMDTNCSAGPKTTSIYEGPTNT